MPATASKESKGGALPEWRANRRNGRPGLRKQLSIGTQEVNVTLSNSQHAELARALDALAREALDEIRERLPQTADEKALDLAGVVHDMGDESVARTHDDLRHILLEHRLSELRKIEAARARLAAGEIDRCADCGSEIGYERLRVNSIATRCIDCQARYEIEHRDQSMLKL